MCLICPATEKSKDCQDKPGLVKATVISNVAFLLAPIYALSQGNPIIAAISLAPGIASTAYHINQNYTPTTENFTNDNSLSKKADVAIAYGVTSLAFITYIKYCKKSYLLSFLILFIVLLALWFYYNNDPKLYCVYHSLWHILCAVAGLLILSLKDFDSRSHNKI